MTFNEVMKEIKTSGKKYTNDNFILEKCIYYVPEKIDVKTKEKEADYIAFEEIIDEKDDVRSTCQYMASMYDIFTDTWKALE